MEPPRPITGGRPQNWRGIIFHLVTTGQAYDESPFLPQKSSVSANDWKKQTQNVVPRQTRLPN